jgi:hypothetical protein
MRETVAIVTCVTLDDDASAIPCVPAALSPAATG